MDQKVNQLKVEVFDLLREQQKHQFAMQQLEQQKNEKLKELAELEGGSNLAPTLEGAPAAPTPAPTPTV